MTATDMIHTDLKLFRDKLPSFSAVNTDKEKINLQDAFLETYRDISSSIHTIHDIHSFMLMMINRCLDYKKASRGIELIPVVETIDLMKLISLPISCMKNIQNKIPIFINNLFVSSSLCTMIQTDKQWLQENLLCLLSNAVKYSSTEDEKGGNVQLSISLIPSGTLKKKPSKVLDEVIVKKDNLPRTLGYKVYRRDSNAERKEDVSTFRKLATSLGMNKGLPSNKVIPSCTLPTDPLSSNISSAAIIKKYQYSGSEISSSSSYAGSVDVSRKSLSVSVTNLQELISEAIIEDPEEYIKNDNEEENHNKPEKEPLINQGTKAATENVLLFEVQDCGKGLSTFELLSFFNPFKQKRLSGGTGLGLYSLAKRLDALGGLYGVHPREDSQSGTVVWFTLPYYPDFPAFSKVARKRRFKSEDRKSSSTLDNNNDRGNNNESNSNHNSSKDVCDAIESFSPVVDPSGKKCDRNFMTTDSFLDSLKPFSPTPISSPITVPVVDNVSVSSTSTVIIEKLRVLIVEDVPLVAKMTSKLLSNQGHSTEIAENGEIAINKVFASYEKNNYHHSSYDIILMDFQMPIMDGLEATNKIREYERNLLKTKEIANHQLIVGVSAMSDSEMIEEAKRLGIDDFIPKPFTSKDFLSYIKRLRIEHQV
jgi:CheY-like chemotaxis protein/signal transduction histidine kinase